MLYGKKWDKCVKSKVWTQHELAVHAVCDIIVDENYFHWQALEQPARPPGQAGQNGKVSK